MKLVLLAIAAVLTACQHLPPRDYQAETGVAFVEVGEGRIGYLADGNPSAPLVILMHGFPDSPHTWDSTRELLAESGFYAVSPFMKGYAPSDVPVEGFDLITRGRETLALIDALEAEQAVIVGHDWGASQAYAAASLNPDRVEKLVAVGIPHPAARAGCAPCIAFRGRHFLNLKQRRAHLRVARNDFAYVDRMYRRWAGQPIPPGHTEPVQNALSAPGSLQSALGYYRDSSLCVPNELKGQIPVPTLAFAGTEDILPVKMYEAAQTFFSGEYEVVVMDGVGHFPHLEASESFHDELLRFLKEDSPGK
ncbi:MAG: pimeloyl-ACP methyl ester carboxylesterase [Myxococcota bacterium]|jgi:pimeloyl-ACP methyl ester carboxylesterase